MRAEILYNWPIGGDNLRFSLGIFTVEDSNYEFHVLFQEPGESEIKYFGKQEWITAEEAGEIEHDFKRGTQIQIIRREKANPENVELRININTDREWPDDAAGDKWTVWYHDF